MLNFKLKLDKAPTRIVWIGGASDISEPSNDPVASDMDTQPSSSVSTNEFQRLEDFISNMANQVDQAIATTSSTSKSSTQLAIELARMMVEKLVVDSPPMMESRLRGIIDESLHAQAPAIAIHVHPDSLASVTQHFQTEALTREELFVADDSVPLFECRIEHEHFDLISNVHHQLDHIETLLQELTNE